MVSCIKFNKCTCIRELTNSNPKGSIWIAKRENEMSVYWATLIWSVYMGKSPITWTCNWNCFSQAASTCFDSEEERNWKIWNLKASLLYRWYISDAFSLSRFKQSTKTLDFFDIRDSTFSLLETLNCACLFNVFKLNWPLASTMRKQLSSPPNDPVLNAIMVD